MNETVLSKIIKAIRWTIEACAVLSFMFPVPQIYLAEWCANVTEPIVGEDFSAFIGVAVFILIYVGLVFALQNYNKFANRFTSSRSLIRMNNQQTFVDEEHANWVIRETKKTALLVGVIALLIIGSIGYFLHDLRVDNLNRQINQVSNEKAALSSNIEKVKSDAALSKDVTAELKSELDQIKNSFSQVTSTSKDLKSNLSELAKVPCFGTTNLYEADCLTVIPKVHASYRELELKLEGLEQRLSEFETRLQRKAEQVASIIESHKAIPSQPKQDEKTQQPPPQQGQYSLADVEDMEVYVTATGSKYHRAGCQYLRRSSIPMSLKKASARYDACSRCW